MRTRMILALATVAVTAAGGTAYAVDKTAPTENPASVAQPANAENSFLKLSNDGLDAMRYVRKARLDIFQGQTDQAIADIAQAKDEAAAAGKQSISLDEMKGLKSDVKADNTTGTEYLPLYATVSVDQTMNLSPQHVDRLTKANMALRSGNTKAAAEALTAVPGDIQYSFASVPLEKLVNGVNDAKSQLDNGKFQEANMSLKSVEDSVRYDSFNLTGLKGKVAENTSYAPGSGGAAQLVQE